MHLTAYRYKSHQRWTGTRGGGWALYFCMDRNDHELTGSFYFSGMLPSVVLASPLGVSGHWHFIQDIGGNARLAILRCYSEVLLSAHVPRMISQQNARGFNL